MLQTIRDVVLVSATVAVGLNAGLFAGFSYAVLPALRAVEDRVFIEVMQRINVVIINPLFLLIFLGAPVFSGAAAALHLGSDVSGGALSWSVAGFVFSLLTVFVTGGINVPLNNRLADAGTPSGIRDPATIREAFENRWSRANMLRAFASNAALVCLLLA